MGSRDMPINRLRRIPSRGKIAGVCAGIADAWQLNLTAVRITAIVLFFVSGGGPMLVAYAAAVVLLDCTEPESKAIRQIRSSIKTAKRVYRAHTSTRTTPEINIDKLKLELLDVKKRTQAIEAYVTSKEYLFQKELAD